MPDLVPAPRPLTALLVTVVALLTAVGVWVAYQARVAPPTELVLERAVAPTTLPAAFLSEVPMSGTPPDRFSMKGVQVGERLPALPLVDLHGQPATLAPATGAHYTVIVTTSLTCPIARLTLPPLAALAQRRPTLLAVQAVYVIEPHPKGDPSPYRDREWITNDNLRDQILVRQPTTLAARLDLAVQFQQRYSPTVPLLVDPLDNATWKAYGGGPNLALVVDPSGKVVYKQGWLEVEPLEQWLAAHDPGDTGAGTN